MPLDPAPAAAPDLPPPPPHRRRGRWNLRSRPTRKTPDRPCLNCGDPTVGFFCPTCGQKKVDVRVSLRRMLGEAMEDELFLNVALPRTLGALLFRPGHLTAEYVQGRIARYIPPFRLYLVSSLLFFILLPWLTNLGRFEQELDEGFARADSARAAQDTGAVAGTAGGRAAGDGAADARAGERTQGAAGRSGVTISLAPNARQGRYVRLAERDTASVPPLLRRLNRHVMETEDRINRMTPGEALRTVRTAFMENAPTGIFFMMPVFAAMLKVLYVRRRRYYVEHFVFALHVHAFTFVTFLLMLLLPWRGVNVALSVWLSLYVLLAMRRVYGQGIVKTFAKYLVLGFAYALLVGFGVAVTMVLTALTL
jgi:hypothetical protein